MNYSKNVRYKRKPKVPLFVKRVLVFWLVALIIGGVIGFLIGRSISAVGLEETEVMAETSTTIPSPTPYVTSTPVQKLLNQHQKLNLSAWVYSESQLIVIVKSVVETGQRTDQLMKMEICLFTQHQANLRLNV